MKRPFSFRSRIGRRLRESHPSVTSGDGELGGRFANDAHTARLLKGVVLHLATIYDGGELIMVSAALPDPAV